MLLLAILIDLCLLPFFVPLILLYFLGYKPKTHLIKHKTPILLLHGSGFNETEWIVGRLFLGKKYGSVFSLSYDDMFGRKIHKGIDDFAKEEIRNKCREICELTNQKEIILIGHSMGGLVASYYAENVAKLDDIKVKRVISIASPWRGSKSIDGAKKLITRYNSKRYNQMSFDSPFSKELRATASQNDIYYNIFSSNDLMVGNMSGTISDQTGQSNLSYCGHYSIIVNPFTWQIICRLLDRLY